ncbi:MAG: hypothetical protein DRJ42_18215 [Deltaproteobacteria bacterium]|nr:MAG: hypothetical protein DRJ42_18215 [Deltaproteobacteria bacterium]
MPRLPASALGCIIFVAMALPFASSLTAPSPAGASDFWDEVKNPGLRRYHRRLAEGRGAAAAGRYEDALTEADAAIARIPNRPEAFVLRGRALGALGRLEDAAEAYGRAFELGPEALSSPTEGRGAAEFLARGGRYELAARILPNVLGRMPPSSTRVELYALYGDVLMSLGPDHLREAVGAYREAVRRGGPHDPRSALGLALALRRVGELEEARALSRGVSARGRLDTVLAALPVSEAERAGRRAVALMAAGDREGARRAWTAAAEGELFREHAQEEITRLDAPPEHRRDRRDRRNRRPR